MRHFWTLVFKAWNGFFWRSWGMFWNLSRCRKETWDTKNVFELLLTPMKWSHLKYTLSFACFSICPEFLYGTARRNILICCVKSSKSWVSSKFWVSCNLKNDEAGYFEKILPWFFRFYEKWTCGIFLIFYSNMQ